MAAKTKKIDQSEFDKFESETNSLFAEFQKKFYRVIINGEAKILKLFKENGSKFDLSTIFQNLMSYGAFHNAYAHKQIYDPQSEKYIPYTHEWIKEEESNMYLDGIVFDPSYIGPGKLGGEFNTYCGMSIAPNNNNSCEKIKQLVKDFFINHPKEDHEYFEKYLAHMMKKPWELPKVAIVMRGAKGTGKGTLMESILRTIWSNHELNTGHIEQVTGKFNSATMNTILVYLAECSWGGYKDQDSVLKNMITNLKISIEKKGKDVFSVNNYSRVFISSNEEWCVPATKDDRRYFFINISNNFIGNTQYFEGIYNEIQNGGINSYLDYLMNIDISNFKPWSDLPEDNLLKANDMIAHSYSSIEKFLDSWIVDGALLATDKNNKIIQFTSVDGKYVQRVNKASFYEKYHQFCVQKNIKDEEKRAFYDKTCNLLKIKIVESSGNECFVFPKTFQELKQNWEISMTKGAK